MKRVCYVVTSPLVVNGFLLNHLALLADHFHISLYVNNLEHPVSAHIDPRVKLIHFDIMRKASPIRDLKALLYLFMEFRREQFDLVHSMTPKAGLLAMLAGWLAGVPERFHIFTGQVWVTRKGFIRCALRLSDKLIAVCATQIQADSISQKQFLEHQGVVRPGRVRVAGKGSICGVNPQRFSRNESARLDMRSQMGIPIDTVVFVFIGRITHDKGVIDLAHAFQRVAKKIETTYLVIAGPDEEGLTNEIKSLVSPFSDRLHIIGGVVDPVNYYSAGDVLVLPSYREGFGMVVLESAAMGLPAIGSRIYGLTDAVVDGETGVLFPVGDVQALTNCMSNLAENPTLRCQLGEAARRRALKDFSSTVISNAWLLMYKQIINGSCKKTCMNRRS